jgi:hypothetical protein
MHLLNETKEENTNIRLIEENDKFINNDYFNLPYHKLKELNNQIIVTNLINHLNTYNNSMASRLLVTNFINYYQIQ